MTMAMTQMNSQNMMNNKQRVDDTMTRNEKAQDVDNVSQVLGVCFLNFFQCIFTYSDLVLYYDVLRNKF